MTHLLKPTLRFKDFEDTWVSYKLESIVDSKRPISYGIVQTGENIENGVKCLRVVDITNGKINTDNLVQTSHSISNQYKRTILKQNDLVIALRGKIGESAVIDESLVGANLTRGVALIALTSKFDSSFLNQQISTPKTRTILERSLNGSALQELSIGVLRNIELKFPSLEEQTKIATFLSAVDSKITSLERLVSHWQAYKKGIMQQIFTKQLRFKAPNGEDFPEWETKTLGEIGSTYNGLSGKTKDDFGSGFPYITYKSVFDNSRVDINRVEYVKVFISSNVEDKSEKQNKVEYGDIFFTVSSETPTEVGMSSVLLDEIDNCYLNSFCFGYRLNDKVSFNPKFFQHYLRSSEMRKCISILAQGSTRYNISASNMMNLEIIVPSSEEQTKIATFLSSLDDKIAHLQQQLTSYRHFKKALLQQMFV